MGLESVNKQLEIAVGVVVTDGFSCAIPNMFLGIEVRAGGREKEVFDTLVFLKKCGHFSEMPGCTVHQE